MDATEIKRLRTQLGLTQAQFADHLGTHRVVVSRWENAHDSPIKVFIVAMRMLANEHEKTRQV